MTLLNLVCEWQLEDIDDFREHVSKADIEEDDSWVRRALVRRREDEGTRHRSHAPAGAVRTPCITPAQRIEALATDHDGHHYWLFDGASDARSGCHSAPPLPNPLPQMVLRTPRGRGAASPQTFVCTARRLPVVPRGRAAVVDPMA